MNDQRKHLMGFGFYEDTGQRRRCGGIVYAQIRHTSFPMLLWRPAEALGLDPLVFRPIEVVRAIPSWDSLSARTSRAHEAMQRVWRYQEEMDYWASRTDLAADTRTLLMNNAEWEVYRWSHIAEDTFRFAMKAEA